VIQEEFPEKNKKRNEMEKNRVERKMEKNRVVTEADKSYMARSLGLTDAVL